MADLIDMMSKEDLFNYIKRIYKESGYTLISLYDEGLIVKQDEIQTTIEIVHDAKALETSHIKQAALHAKSQMSHLCILITTHEITAINQDEATKRQVLLVDRQKLLAQMQENGEIVS